MGETIKSADAETQISPETFKRYMTFIKDRATSPRKPGEFNKEVKSYGGTYIVDPEEGQLAYVTSVTYGYWDNSAVPREGGDDAQLAVYAGINRASEVEVLTLHRSDNGINFTSGGGMSEAADDNLVNDTLDKIEALEAADKVHAQVPSA